jgi:hypothetical protein
MDDCKCKTRTRKQCGWDILANNIGKAEKKEENTGK